MEMHPERPERLVAARAGLKRAVAPDELVRFAARPVSDEEVLRVHTESYLRGLRDALSAGWGHLDADTFFSPASEETAWLAAGGAVELCRAVVAGTVQRGLALLRPPGHHAVASRAMGFCLLNNIAMAAADALARGLSRVAIVDWDVHHGNGTQRAGVADRSRRSVLSKRHHLKFGEATCPVERFGGGRLRCDIPAGAGRANARSESWIERGYRGSYGVAR